MADHYDEFSLFHENAAEAGLDWDGAPTVRRESVQLDDGRSVSALVWGTDPAEIVFLHGGAQNAHTWDTVALALRRPLVAIDLPGHGHSDWKDDGDYGPPAIAADVTVAMDLLAPQASTLVGMSLGGLTAACVAAANPSRFARVAIVDVTPGTDHGKAKAIIDFITGPEEFDSFDEILARTIEFNPTRSESSLRRGVLHNAYEGDDGKWRWRYDPVRQWRARGRDTDGQEEIEEGGDAAMPDFGALWDAFGAIESPLLLLRGADSPVVGDEDVDELLRRNPEAEIITVTGAGHSIQGDQPVKLAELLVDYIART